MRNLHFRDYLTMRLPKPAPGEQAKIARILDTVDASIEGTRTTIDKARRLKQGLIQKAIESISSPPVKLGTFTKDIRYGTSQASNDNERGFPTLNGAHEW